MNVSPVSHTVAPPSDTFNIFWYIFSSVDFVWKADGTVPQNSNKPSQDLWEATLKKEDNIGYRVARSFGIDRHTQRSYYLHMTGTREGLSDQQFY